MSSSITLGYHFGATEVLTDYSTIPLWSSLFADTIDIVSDDMLRRLLKCDTKCSIRTTRAGAINMVVSNSSVKNIAKVFGPQMGLSLVNFTSTIDNAKDNFAKKIVDKKLSKNWHETTTFTTQIETKQYRANSIFMRLFVRICLTHAMIDQQDRERIAYPVAW